MKLIDEADQVYLETFGKNVGFERAIFFSWYCAIGDCKYCYMSTQPKNKPAVRSIESILAELIICKQLGWKIGFISGGHEAFSTTDFAKLLKSIYEYLGEKVWINIGPLNRDQLKQFKPYVKGVTAAIEILNPKLHKEICPSKSLADMEKMLVHSIELGFKTAITIIIGLGEQHSEFPDLAKFIRKYNISKIHVYSLNPQVGTPFEHAQSPSPEEQAEWIAKLRIEFPKLDIQAGIWEDKVNRVSLLFRAGANSISKYPALRRFGSASALEIEKQARIAKRTFVGSLSILPKIDVNSEIKKFDENLQEKIRDKLNKYLKKMT